MNTAHIVDAYQGDCLCGLDNERPRIFAAWNITTRYPRQTCRTCKRIHKAKIKAGHKF